MKHTMIVAFFALLAQTTLALECTPITEDAVHAAQKAWGDGVVAIGAAPDPKIQAETFVDALYAYDLGKVLFKPTKAEQDEFRETREEAISYFVGGVDKEDHGFALAPYTKVRFENNGIVSDCNSALSMGNYYFMDAKGQELKVDYSFSYIKASDSTLKINLHHSSLPYHSKETPIHN